MNGGAGGQPETDGSGGARVRAGVKEAAAQERVAPSRRRISPLLAGSLDAPAFGVGEAVARLTPEFPDVTISSLHFFEREGLLSPARTPGGHRLYGPSDVERVRLIKRWQRDDRLSLSEIRARLDAAESAGPADARSRALLRHALDGESQAAHSVLIDAYDLGVPLLVLFEEVVGPALRDIGAQWAAGTISIAQEHEVTAVVQEAVAAIAARLPTPVTPRAVVVAACVAGEEHALGLRMAAAVLQSEQFRVHYLGADVPASAIAESVRRRRASVLLLSLTQSERLGTFEETVRTIAALPEGVRPRILAGGSGLDGATSLLEELGVTHITSLQSLIALVPSLSERD